MNIFKWLKKDKPQEKPEVVITEGVSGHWHYHLSYKDNTTHALCGEQVMQTSCSLKDWGHVGHLKETYCEKCKKIYDGII